VTIASHLNGLPGIIGSPGHGQNSFTHDSPFKLFPLFSS
jgi:hypothetical protein